MYFGMKKRKFLFVFVPGYIWQKKKPKTFQELKNIV